jgi:hypothetical protein
MGIFSTTVRSPNFFGREVYPDYKIRRHAEALGGAPGAEISGLEQVAGGHRIRYQHGVIYVTPDTDPAWVYGAIAERYNALGGADSWLGLPLADEAAFDDGRISRFQHGDVYWWPDVGAIDINEVIVHYTGLICFGETDWDQGSDSDEPYVIFGVLTPAGNAAYRTRIYEDVDGGEGVSDLIELYRGKPLGIGISSSLMEYDFGDPDKFKAEVEKAVKWAYEGAAVALNAAGPIGNGLSVVAVALEETAVPAITNVLNSLLDTGDDVLGTRNVLLSPKQMVVLAARTGNSESRGVGFKTETPLFEADGASYKAFFGLIPA